MKRYLRIALVFGGIMAASTFWAVASASQASAAGTCYMTPNGWVCI